MIFSYFYSKLFFPFMEQKNLSENTTKNCQTLKIFNHLEKNNIEYVYIGHFTSNITDSILSLAELNLQLLNESIKIRKRVYFILVEGLQNITRHQQFTPSKTDKSAGLIIQNKNNEFIITTINHIHITDKEKIKQHIDNINQLEKNELKNFYRKILKQQKISNKGGAGLGLIEIARKSNNKLIYDFVDIDDKYPIFFFQIFIHSENNKSFELDAQKNLQNIKKVYFKLIECSVIFSLSGIFVQDKLVYMLSLLEQRLLGKASNKNKIFNIIVELLQNILNHADNFYINSQLGKYGIFYIKEQEDYLSLVTGNYVKNEKINTIKNIIDEVNSISLRELTTKHRKILANIKNNKTEVSGLGLINLRIKTKDKINYFITKVNNEFSFLSIEVKVSKQKPKLFKLSIKATKNTPEIFLSPSEVKYHFSGTLNCSTPIAFFSPVYNWLKKYLKNPHSITPISFEFTNINEYTKQALEKLFSLFDILNKKSIVIIKWYYKSENSNVYKIGKYLEKLFPEIEFKFIKKE